MKRKHTSLVKAVKEWFELERGAEILPARSWLNPLNIDVLAKEPPLSSEDIYLFDLCEVKASREDLQRAPYQLETCRILLEDRGATRCYIAMPFNLVNTLEHAGEYPFFIAAIKRFGYGVITVSPAYGRLNPFVYWKPKIFRRIKEATWK